MSADSTRVALLITDMLERLSVVYAVEGSLSSSEYGVSRSSLNAAIIADLRPEHVEPFVSALSADFYVDPHRVRDAIQQRGAFSVVHYASKFNVDIVIPKLRPFDEMQLKRRRAVVVSTSPPHEISVSSPEDAILYKLERLRTAGVGQKLDHAASRLLDEVSQLLNSQVGALDLDYLRHWARELNVVDLLDRAMHEA
jgi:hypothetical protein